MPLWIIYALSSYFFTALSNTIDKVVVTTAVPKPVVYAFYVGILGGLSVILIPFGVGVPRLAVILAAFCAGFFFIMALFTMYTALVKGETTRVVPVLHAVIPIATFVLAYLFLGERLTELQLFAFVVLIIGLLIIEYRKDIFKTNGYKNGLLAVVSGVLFACNYTLAKFVYLNQDFLTGFTWMRMGALLTVSIIFLIPAFRKQIVTDIKTPNTKKGPLVIGNQIIGAAGFVLLDLAINSASVTLVQSLQGVLYAFVFIIVMVMGRWVPSVREKLTPRIAAQKLIAMCIIAFGLYLLAQ